MKGVAQKMLPGWCLGIGDFFLPQRGPPRRHSLAFSRVRTVAACRGRQGRQATGREEPAPDTSPCSNVIVCVSDYAGRALASAMVTSLLPAALCGSPGSGGCVVQAGPTRGLSWARQPPRRGPRSQPPASPFVLSTPLSRRPLAPPCHLQSACPRRTRLRGNVPDPLAGNRSARKSQPLLPTVGHSRCQRSFRNLLFQAPDSPRARARGFLISLSHPDR